MPVGMADSEKNIQKTVDAVVERLRRTIESDIHGLVDNLQGGGSASTSRGPNAMGQTDN